MEGSDGGGIIEGKVGCKDMQEHRSGSIRNVVVVVVNFDEQIQVFIGSKGRYEQEGDMLRGTVVAEDFSKPQG